MVHYEEDRFEFEDSEESDLEGYVLPSSDETILAENEDGMIFEGKDFDSKQSIALPPYIPLSKIASNGSIKWMKRRSIKAIRFHKYNQTKDPHQWYFSEMLLYLPFTNENDLFPEDLESCMDLYLKNEEKISKIRSQVMPYLRAVEEARENAETYLSNVGDELDPTKEQMDVENEAEGISEHPELSFKAPDLREENSTVSDKTFRAIELQSDSELSDRL